MTISEFFSDLDLLTNNKLTRFTTSQQLRFLNRSIINTWIDLKYFIHELSAYSSIVFTDGVADLPSDLNTDNRTDLVLYADIGKTQLIGSYQYRIDQNKILMPEYNGTVYIEYTKEPSVYTATSETLIEANNRRAFEILQSEVEHLVDINYYQGQVSAQSQGSRFRANEIR